MKNNLSTLSTLYISALLVFSGNATADIDIDNGNAFLFGDNIEVGIGPDGAFGSDSPLLEEGRKSYGHLLGFISDPTGNYFDTSYHGDFFLSGIPEEGWGVAFDDDPNRIYNNNSNKQGNDIFGNLSEYQDTTYDHKVTWKGVAKIEENSDIGLEITQVYRVYTKGTAVVFDVTLKNTTSTVMNNVYYMRTVDPDNNAEQYPEEDTSKYITTNTILSQGSDGDGISAVSATQDAMLDLFTQSSLTLSGYGANSRVTYGGNIENISVNRKPSDVYNGTNILQQSGTNTADESISLAFKFDKLEPGDSVTFRAGYQLKEVPVPIIDIDENDSSGESGNGFRQLYILESTASNITDTDISITGDGFNQLQQAIITLTNPHDGDLLEILGELPAGIIIDTDESTDTEIRLKGLVSNEGLASKEDFQTALKQAVFSNINENRSSDTDPRIDTRIITIQLIDENSTLSNAALSIICITTPVVIDSPIAEDDVVNEAEVANVTLTGHAAPNASITIDFTDINGKKLAPAKTVTADENGQWTLEGSPADLSSLSDGKIEVLVTAIDQNENVATQTKEVIKDTTILLTDIKPVDAELVSNFAPTYEGKTDPNASITLKIMPNGKVYTTTADTEGNWSIPLDKFPLGVTVSTEITAKDEYGNQTSSTQSFKTPNLPLSVIAPQDNSTTEDTTPTFFGTSTPGTTVKVKIATGQECTAIADSDGKWSCELPVLPVGGPYLVSINAVDEEGNTASITESIKVPEISLLISSPVAGEIITTNGVTVTGISDPNTTIKVVGPDGESCETTSDSQGEWSCQLDELQSGSEKHITVISGEGTVGEKVSIRIIDIEAPSEKVKTVLTGSSSLSLLFGLCFLLLFNLLRKKRQI